MDASWITLCCTCLLVLAAWCGKTDAADDKDSEYGHWGDWGQWSPCSVTCGMGVMEMERKWIPGPKDTRKKTYTSSKVFSCTNTGMPNCPIHGQWSGWTSWSACTKACGQGTKKRTRECRGKRYGGNACDGDEFEEAPCKRDPCPVIPRGFQMSQCTAKNFTCTSKRQCILSGQKCDDKVQCHDGSDESGCPVRHIGAGSIRYVLNRDGGASTIALAKILQFLSASMTAVGLFINFNSSV